MVTLVTFVAFVLGVIVGLAAGLITHMVLKRKGLNIPKTVEESVSDIVGDLLREKEDLEEALAYWESKLTGAGDVIEEGWTRMIDDAKKRVEEIKEELKEALDDKTGLGGN